MAGFDVVRETPLPASQAWERVTDWKLHGEHAPLTSVTVHGSPGSPGESFVARTAVGPFGFDDPMAVTYRRRPTATDAGIARLVKQGTVVLGWAVLTVTPTASGSEVHWHEEARLRFTRGPVVTVVNKVLAVAFGRLLDSLLRP
ncbi:MAG: SRPBCC family protein [Nocardioidaceae bacterium]